MDRLKIFRPTLEESGVSHPPIQGVVFLLVDNFRERTGKGVRSSLLFLFFAKIMLSPEFS